jgi:hypothetical protein
MIAKGRRKQGVAVPERRCRGQMVKTSKLMPDQVVAIRKMCADGSTMKAAADEYSVSPALVCMIVHKKIWAHVE